MGFYSVRAANEMGGLSQPSASVELSGASGLSALPPVVTSDSQKYNLKGQRVADSSKGLIIMQGRKYVTK